MQTFRVTSPDGTKLKITGEAMPSEAELDEIFKSVAPKPKSAAQAFVDRGVETVQGLGSLALDAGKSALTMEGQAKFLPRMAANMYEGAVQSGADAITRQQTPTRKALAAVPVLGPYVMNAVSDIEEGKGSEVAGRTAFDALTMAVPGSPGGRAALEAGASGAVRGAGAAAKAGATVAKAVGPEVAAGVAGEVLIGGLGGGVGGAAIGHLLRPKVAAWLKERFGMSAAKAEATAGKMSEKALADLAERESILEAKQIAAVENKVIKREIADAKKMAKVDSKIRPIPPNKLPPVLPDPVVPEIAPAPKPVVAPEAPAVAPAVDEAAARAARQNQHIADSYRAKAEKDAKNVAAEDSLLFDLERSIEHLKKRGPEKPAPSPAQSIAEKVKERVISMKKQGMSRGQMKSSVLEDILRRQDGYKPADVQRAVDLILEETTDAPAPIRYSAPAPSEFKAKVAENKTKGAELAAALDGSEVPKSGDMARKNDYRIAHRPMEDAGGASRIHDLTSGSFDENIYGKNALQYYGSGDPREVSVLNTLKNIRGKPDAKLIIYRGVPNGVDEIAPGDWVTLSESVAKDYADRVKGRVISMEVRAADVTASADSILENGYSPRTPSATPDKRTAMLDTAKAKLKKKKKE